MTRDDRELLKFIWLCEASNFGLPSIADMKDALTQDDIQTSINVLQREGMIGRVPWTKPKRYQTTNKGRLAVLKEAA